MQAFFSSKFDDSTFQNIGASIISLCKSLKFCIDSEAFKTSLFANIDIIITNVQDIYWNSI